MTFDEWWSIEDKIECKGLPTVQDWSKAGWKVALQQAIQVAQKYGALNVELELRRMIGES